MNQVEAGKEKMSRGYRTSQLKAVDKRPGFSSRFLGFAP